MRLPLLRRGGHDPRYIDPFLESVVQRLEGYGPKDSLLDVAAVHNARFATVRRGGYALAEVDAFLDSVIDTLDPNHAVDRGVTPDDARPGPQKAVSSAAANAVWDPSEVEILEDPVLT